MGSPTQEYASKGVAGTGWNNQGLYRKSRIGFQPRLF